MNRSQAEVYARLHGTPLMTCLSGEQRVWCRVLSLDEAQALYSNAQVWLTGLTGVDDNRLLFGYVVDKESRGFSFKQGRLDAGSWPVIHRGNYYRYRRFVEPLEDEECT